MQQNYFAIRRKLTVIPNNNKGGLCANIVASFNDINDANVFKASIAKTNPVEIYSKENLINEVKRTEEQ